MSCIFCDFANVEKECFKIWEDNHFLAFFDINPINPGHTLLIPKEHVTDVFEMRNDSYEKLFNTAKILVPKIKKAIGAPRVGLAIEGFGVNHVHIHLVPVHNSNELNPERASVATSEDLQIIQQKILNEL